MSSFIHRSLITLELLVGATSVAGGIGLIMTGGLGMPVAWLAGSWFHSFLGPGVILFAVVGGSNLVAAYCTWKKNLWAREWSATAGFGLLIWIFTEEYIIRQSHILQIIYFVIGIVIVVLTMMELKYDRAGARAATK